MKKMGQGKNKFSVLPLAAPIRMTKMPPALLATEHSVVPEGRLIRNRTTQGALDPACALKSHLTRARIFLGPAFPDARGQLASTRTRERATVCRFIRNGLVRPHGDPKPIHSGRDSRPRGPKWGSNCQITFSGV